MNSQKKHGQATVFIILALVIVLVMISLIMISFWQAKQPTKPPIQRAGTFEGLIGDISQYVEGCIAKEAEPVLISLADHGGRLEPAGQIFLNGTKLHVLCINNNRQGCVSTLTTRASLENEVSAETLNRIAECIRLERQFSATGAQIKTRDPKLNVSIAIDSVFLTLNYPVEVKLGQNQRELNIFTATIDIPLGRLFGTALDITNDVASTGFFDAVEYMTYHDTSILIEVYKPYPNTAYQLRRFNPKTGQDFLFQFALQGTKTAGREPLYLAPKFGCCYANDNTCHVNVPESECKRIGKSEQECRCPANAYPVVEGCCVQANQCSVTTKEACAGQFYENDRVCNQAPGCTSLDCPQTYSMSTRTITAGPRKNGESWCVYDGRVGNGNDLVGSRHVVHSCIRGREYVEACRDFREELCTEEKRSTTGGATLTHAACRINRFADCTRQGSSSCLDYSVRDCEWLVYGGNPIYNRVRCVPAVAPGLPHYEGIGQGVCREVSDDNPPPKRRRTWGHDVCWACQRAGDCGPKHNIADVLSMGGYFNPDGQVEASKLLPAGSTRVAYPGLTLPLSTRKIPPLVSARPDILVNPSDGGSYAICSLWQVPGSGNCAMCESNPYWQPCSEYRCRSIGANCRWTETAGIGHCSATTPASTPEPRVRIIQSNPPVVQSQPNEYQLQGTIIPHEPWNLTIESDQSVRCRMTAVPKDFHLLTIDTWGVTCPLPTLPRLCFRLPIIQFSDSQFTTKHQTVARFPSKDSLAEDMEELDPNVLNDPRVTALLSTLETIFMRGVSFYIKCENEKGVEAKEIKITAPFAPGIALAPPKVIELHPSQHEISPEQISSRDTINIALFTDRPFNECRVTPQGMPSINLSCLPVNERDIRYGIFVPPGSYECAGSELTLNAPSFTFTCTNKAGTGPTFSYVPGPAP